MVYFVYLYILYIDLFFLILIGLLILGLFVFDHFFVNIQVLSAGASARRRRSPGAVLKPVCSVDKSKAARARLTATGKVRPTQHSSTHVCGGLGVTLNVHSS